MPVLVEFSLSMPRAGSWDGKWSGDGQRYTRIHPLPHASATSLDGRTWTHSFGDGWIAAVSARIIPKGERPGKSAGFQGYDWMVESIIRDGMILTAPSTSSGRAGVV